MIYMYNKTTTKSIFVGTKCYNKFELQSQTIKDEVYRNILLDAIRKGEYEVIDDIVIYSEYVMNRHIEYYRNIIDKNKNKLWELLSIRKNNNCCRSSVFTIRTDTIRDFDKVIIHRRNQT